MMKNLRLPDREKTQNELTRRYEEVVRKSERGIHNDEEAQQFISLLTHYVYYVKKSGLTEGAITKLFNQQEALASDKLLIEEAEKIIEQLKKDRDTIVRYANSKGVDTGKYQFDTSGRAQQITLDKEVSFNLSFLNNYLDLPSDQQQVSQLPREISNFRSAVFATIQLTRETPTLKKLRDHYQTVASEFEKQLKMQGVFLDYLRIEDYKALEVVWREVYQEGDRDERIMFHLMYGDLFEKNRNFSGGQQKEADDFVSKHVTHLQRVHNYLIDCLEDVSFKEKLLHWTVEHFGPTLVSLVIIIIISLLLHWIGINKGIEELRSLLGF